MTQQKTDSDTPSETQGEHERPSERARLTALSEAIASIRTSAAPTQTHAHANSIHLAWRLVGEMLAGIAVGGFIGWWMDKWFSTAPIFLLIMLFLGMIAGLMNALRTIRRLHQ